MTDQFEALLSKHISGNLTEEEQILLGNLLTDPEKQLYLASRIDRDFADVHISEEENDTTGAEIFERIRQQIYELKAGSNEEQDHVITMYSRRRRLYRIAAVAASAAVLVFAVLFWNKTSRSNVATDNKLVEIKVTEQRQINTSGKEKRIAMSDGSLIVLADKSEIVYHEPFKHNRNIELNGKAYFKVFKDSSSAFTVISGDISTTALGTEFTVTAFKESKQIVVRLYEGKVVIRPVNKLNSKMKKEVYLKPGQEFVYGNNDAAKNKVYKKNALPEQVLNEEKFLDDPSIPEGDKGSWYMFNNQLLSQTLDQLSALYNTRIVYNKKDVQHVYFTGKYERTELLETILKRIGTINNLKVSKNDTAFIITK